jgi:hypothetical protein
MNFWVTLLILFDRQLVPLAAHVKQLQNVIGDRVQRKFRSRTATARTSMGQDKLLELLATQFCRNPLPLLVFRHFQPQKDRDFRGPARP